jgi:hypothetical protein
MAGRVPGIAETSADMTPQVCGGYGAKPVDWHGHC